MTKAMQLAICVIVLSLVIPITMSGYDPAFAQNSLGIGRPEQAIRPEGPFAAVLFWIQQHQLEFYRMMTDELKAIRGDGKHIWLLAGLSFIYGVFHAAGPGHGKAVISSYMLAHEIAARRGILLALASAFLQAISAIVLIAILMFALRGFGIRQGEITRWLEIVSYGAITLLGAWLLYAKITNRSHQHSHDMLHTHEHGHHRHDGGCGALSEDHLHIPDPVMLGGKMGLRQAWSAVLAVGLRPCSGALIVLTFAFLNGLLFAGIASAFAMAVGTGLTVATLAALAVWAKDVAIRIGGAADRAAAIHRAIEIGGAGLVLLLGILLLSASLY